MAQTLEFLTRQNATLTSIRGIVHTMKTLSAINASPYEQAAVAIEAYHQSILQGFAAFAQRTGGLKLDQPSANSANSRSSNRQQLLIVLGSDHGLCGNYNENLAALVKEFCQTQQVKKRKILCVGAQMSDALVDLELIPDKVLMPPASAEGIGRLAGALVTRIEAFNQTLNQTLSHTNSSVSLAFTQRGEHGLSEPSIKHLLPLDPKLLQPKKVWPSRSLPDYSLAPEHLLAALIRNHIFASVFRASAEAMVTENAARLALMQQAEQSVDERLEEVKGELSYVRQTEITDELMDVIIGHL